jgi:hypothetical protein
VAEKLKQCVRNDLHRKLGVASFVFFAYPDGGWYANFSGFKGASAYAETAPLAICLAALKAKGVQVDE